MVVIEHHGWTITVDPALGGSTRSLNWKGQNVLRPADSVAVNPLDLASFPLAPFCNRIDFSGFDFEGVFYPLPTNMDGVALPIHGFAWQRAWRVSERRADGIKMELEDRQSLWPQPYRVEQNIALAGDSARFSIALTNIGEGDMPAGIGFHPYFSRGNSRCEVDPGKMWVQDAHGLPMKLSSDHGLAKGSHSMRDIRLDHSFSGWDGTAVITDPDRWLETRLSASENLRELVVYSPAQDFFCLEPVSHVTNAVHGDSAAKRTGWQTIAPGEILSGWFELSVKELS